MLKTTGLTEVQLRIKPDPSLDDLERMKVLLLDRINKTPKGLLVNCKQLTKLSVDTLATMHGLKTFAESEGKRLTLCGLAPELHATIAKHSSTFALDVFGAPTPPKPIEVAVESKASIRKAQIRRWAKTVGIPVLIFLPIIVAAEYYFLVYADTKPPSTITKSFEASQEPRFIVYGTVLSVLDGRRIPDAGAAVMVWVASDPQSKTEQSAKTGWVTYADASGRFRLPLEINDSESRLYVRVAIMSEVIAATKAQDPSRPSPQRLSISDPSRQTNTYEYWVENGTPLRVDAMFF